ncbi:unnamed protein product [Ostreobium quekettii]|uniref:Uncharacterized protein n=1 Tax=Ostreobium quekettii TaxID=121088 RepID=A0A8S1JBN1_9CHLO|nr:unnamed protein product [Ostreobium quekettii]
MDRSSAATSGVGGAPGTVPWPAELSTWGQEAALLQSLDSMGPDSIPAFNDSALERVGTEIGQRERERASLQRNGENGTDRWAVIFQTACLSRLRRCSQLYIAGRREQIETLVRKNVKVEKEFLSEAEQQFLNSLRPRHGNKSHNPNATKAWHQADADVGELMLEDIAVHVSKGLILRLPLSTGNLMSAEKLAHRVRLPLND